MILDLTLEFSRIRNLAILTEDVEKLVKFYTTAFGLKIVHGVGTATYLFDGISTWRSFRSGRSGRSKDRSYRWGSIVSVSRWRTWLPFATFAKN